MQANLSALNLTRSAKAAAPAHPEVSVSAETVQFGEKMLNEAIQNGWNMEMDWLWLATKVTVDVHRRYCLDRALKINPDSEMAKLGLRQLWTHPGQPITF